MKVLKSLILTICVTSATVSLAHNEDSEKKTRHIRSAPTSINPSFLVSVQTAKHVISTRNILKANYKDLQHKQEIAEVKAQRKQRIAARKEQRQHFRNVQKLEKFSADKVNTLNVARLMADMFMYPQVENFPLEEAIVHKAQGLQGPRKTERAQNRKEKYLEQLDFMFYGPVSAGAKKFDLDKYGQRQIKKVRPSLLDQYHQSPFTAQAVRPSVVDRDVQEKYITPHLVGKYQQAKAAGEDVESITEQLLPLLIKQKQQKDAKDASLSVKEVFERQKPQTRAFAKRIKVWGKIHNKAAAAA